MGVKYDFGGYATKVGLKCTDGRVIRRDAFVDQDGERVPLVWNHNHNNPENILGHGILENRRDGVYIRGKFNDSSAAKHAKILLQHGDIVSLSIWANDLIQKGFDVCHGVIREVSLVLAPANPGAFIDDVSFQHGESDGDEAIIYTGLKLDLGDQYLSHSDEDLDEEDEEDDDEDLNEEDEEDDDHLSHADDSGKTVGDVFNSMSEEQKKAVYYVVGSLLAEDMSGDEASHSSMKEGDDSQMKKNVFDGSATTTETPTLTHAQFSAIMEDAKKCGSFKQAFLSHAQQYGIENIDILFPYAV